MLDLADIIIFNNRMNKLTLLALSLIILSTSCQSSSTSVSNQSEAQKQNSSYKEQILSEKKRQAEMDLPIRSFPTDQKIQTLAFGSCADQDQPQPIWSQIEKNEPDLMIMLGDGVYASAPHQKPISEQYLKSIKVPEYRSIREKVPFMSIWDDHDFGQNDGGASNPEKDEARTQFLKYWPYIKALIPESQKALYHSKIFGDKKHTLQVIVLDTRYERSDLKRNEHQTPEDKATAPKPYVTDDDKSKRILSEEQWQWFEQQLKKKADLRVIASSIQVIANDHQFEKWGNFPHERERFFNLLKKLKIKNAVIISGDRHMAAIAKKEIRGLGTLHEITASSINRPARLGNNFVDASYIADGYGLLNFGLLKIDWIKREVTAEIRSTENQAVQTTKFTY